MGRNLHWSIILTQHFFRLSSNVPSSWGEEKNPLRRSMSRSFANAFRFAKTGLCAGVRGPSSHFGARPDDVTRFAAIRAGQPAGFEINGRHVVRVMYAGKTRRIAAGRIGWAISTGEWPRGSIKARDGNERDLRPANLIQVRHGRDPFGAISDKRDGNERDLRPANLIQVRHGRDPFGAISDKRSKGGRGSSLQRRQASNAALIKAMAESSGALTPATTERIGGAEHVVLLPAPDAATGAGPHSRACLQPTPPLEPDPSRTGARRRLRPGDRRSRPTHPWGDRPIATAAVGAGPEGRVLQPDSQAQAALAHSARHGRGRRHEALHDHRSGTAGARRRDAKTPCAMGSSRTDQRRSRV